MKLPILAYGDPILKKVAQEIDQNYPNLNQLLADMFETMYAAHGVGLAAAQIGLSIRLFVIDATPYSEDEPDLENFKKVFINARVEEENGKDWVFNEGCLSIPDIREDIYRKESLKISYYDENWHYHEEVYSGFAARIIQHEYDHIEGKLFTDRLTPLRKRMLQNRLQAISKGQVKVEYKMRFPLQKKSR